MSNSKCRVCIKRIHVAHIVVDGMVDAPDTLGKMLGEELFQQLRETKGMEHDGLILPERVMRLIFIYLSNTDLHGVMKLILGLFQIQLGGIVSLEL